MKFFRRIIFPGDNSKPSNLFVQRSAPHFGLPPQVSIYFWNRYSGLPEILSFDPLNGKVLSSSVGSADLKQVILLHHSDDTHLRPLLLLSKNKKATLFPESGLSSVSDSTFVVTVEDDRTISGQKLVKSGNSFKLLPLWTLAHPHTNKVTLWSKSSEEKVHSQVSLFLVADIYCTPSPLQSLRL